MIEITMTQLRLKTADAIKLIKEHKSIRVNRPGEAYVIMTKEKYEQLEKGEK